MRVVRPGPQLPAGRQPKKKKKPKAVKEPKAAKAAKAVPAPKKAKKPKKGGSGGSGGGGEGGEGGGDDGGEEKEEFTATGRRKRKTLGKTRAVPRAWTGDEERLFREALELHGRTWQKCAEHVGTRDSKSFTGHAQKYFKLCLQGKALPRAVAATGEGYTLSGKPLDPQLRRRQAVRLQARHAQQARRGGRRRVRLWRGAALGGGLRRGGRGGGQEGVG